MTRAFKGKSAMANATASKFDAKLFLAKLGKGQKGQLCNKGEGVYAQGESATAVFFIKSGKVKVAVVSAQGREAVVALLTRGDFFGEGCLAGQQKRTASVVAIEDCSLVRIEKAAIQALLRDDPDFAGVFITHLLARGIRVEEDLIDQLFNSSEKRLARALLLLANFGTEGPQMPIVTKLSHETLAEMVGTTRSRISFFMNKFRKLGFIEYNGTLQIHNSLLSVLLNDKDSPHKLIVPAHDGVSATAPCRRRAPKSS
jgi:CRP/FNR family transcriptional regulator, cyclic AMP receptor protein